MYISEREWDRRLGIVTTGLDATHADLHHNAYEPTPYTVLGRLVESGYVRESGNWIDYGCGKGRVSFFLHAHTGCRITGVEFEPSIYEAATENHKNCGQPEKVSFVCAHAENYEIGDADHFRRHFHAAVDLFFLKPHVRRAKGDILFDGFFK